MRNLNKYYKIFALIVVGVMLYSCKNTGKKELVILYDYSLEEVKTMAEQEDKAFCIVMSRPDCPPCVHYVQNLGELYRDMATTVIFNIVDISLPENKWYQQWLCSDANPTTCVFSRDGHLTAVVSGGLMPSFNCIKSSILGNSQCAAYFYEKNFPAKSGAIAMLNTLLSCKLKLEDGEDISNEIETCLGKKSYPYSVFLKYLNEEKQGRHEEAVYWAKQFLSFNNRIYNHVYGDLYAPIKKFVNPNYTPADDAVLSVVNEVRLERCQVNVPLRFSIKISNTGKSPMFLYDIGTSCDCIKLISASEQTLMPQETKIVDFEFTADTQGELSREITFISNATNSMEKIQVLAKVKES